MRRERHDCVTVKSFSFPCCKENSTHMERKEWSSYSSGSNHRLWPQLVSGSWRAGPPLVSHCTSFSRPSSAATRNNRPLFMTTPTGGWLWGTLFHSVSASYPIQVDVDESFLHVHTLHWEVALQLPKAQTVISILQHQTQMYINVSISCSSTVWQY